MKRKKKQKKKQKKEYLKTFPAVLAAVLLVAAWIGIKHKIETRHTVKIITIPAATKVKAAVFYKEGEPIKKIKFKQGGEYYIPVISPGAKYLAVIRTKHETPGKRKNPPFLALYNRKGEKLFSVKPPEGEIFRGVAEHSPGCALVADNGNTAIITKIIHGRAGECPNKIHVYGKDGFEKLNYPVKPENRVYDCYSLRFSPNGIYFSVSDRENTIFFNLKTGKRWRTDYGMPVEVLSLTNDGSARFMDPEKK